MRKPTHELNNNVFVRGILYALERSEGRLGKSTIKRLLDMALLPIKEELIVLGDRWNRLASNGFKYEFDYKGENIAFYLPNVMVDSIQTEIFERDNFYENDILEYVNNKYLQAGMIILDCGSNIGNHTIYFSKIAKAKEIFAFEGNPPTYEILKNNVQINGVEDVCHVFNCVLGEHSGQAEIASFDINNIGGTSFKESSKGIEMRAIDEMDFPQKVDFVKMDVEGFEAHVIKGMGKLLQQDKPLLWIETFRDKQENVFSLLNSLNYEKIDSMRDDNYIFKSKDV